MTEDVRSIEMYIYLLKKHLNSSEGRLMSGVDRDKVIEEIAFSRVWICFNTF